MMYTIELTLDHTTLILPTIQHNPLLLVQQRSSLSHLNQCLSKANDISQLEDDASATNQLHEDLVKPTPHPPPLTTFRQLTDLSYTHSFSLALNDVRIDDMLHRLSSDELETAARCNFVYLKHPCPERRHIVAREMAVRYLRSKRDTDKALKYMKATIAFRQNLDIDRLRLAFCETTNKENDSYRQKLEDHLASKMVYVQGYDKQGRATYIFEPYRVKCHDVEWTIKQHVWALERAIACTKVQDKTVNAVINFNGFSAFRHSPPTQVGQQFLDILRNHYIGHVHQIYIVDAPRSFLCLWAIFKPMLSDVTKSRIVFVSTSEEKYQTIGQLYSDDQATPWMLPTGTKGRELDLHEFLYETPFDKAFDE